MSASKHVEPNAVREHHKASSLAGWHADTTWYVYKSVSKMIPWKHMRVAHTVHEVILVFCFRHHQFRTSQQNKKPDPEDTTDS